GKGTEQPRIGRFMPGPGSRRPLSRKIQASQHVAEREHAVVMAKIVLAHRIGIRDGAMMRVVKEKLKARAGGATLTDSRDQGGGAGSVTETVVGCCSVRA